MCLTVFVSNAVNAVKDMFSIVFRGFFLGGGAGIFSFSRRTRSFSKPQFFSFSSVCVVLVLLYSIYYYTPSIHSLASRYSLLRHYIMCVKKASCCRYIIIHHPPSVQVYIYQYTTKYIYIDITEEKKRGLKKRNQRANFERWVVRDKNTVA